MTDSLLRTAKTTGETNPQDANARIARFLVFFFAGYLPPVLASSAFPSMAIAVTILRSAKPGMVNPAAWFWPALPKIVLPAFLIPNGLIGLCGLWPR